ncbi:hypothetical protein NQ317_007929 [Molorchus minor]|uniref:Uncharacterized protein n=1 Tax=Molorchus minor TaxID=1323400 RepID=A0ABQ9JQF4_9CUCU|nr:hypothetical protein NQ317_007929 [Molorchus minor]
MQELLEIASGKKEASAREQTEEVHKMSVKVQCHHHLGQFLWVLGYRELSNHPPGPHHRPDILATSAPSPASSRGCEDGSHVTRDSANEGRDFYASVVMLTAVADVSAWLGVLLSVFFEILDNLRRLSKLCPLLSLITQLRVVPNGVAAGSRAGPCRALCKGSPIRCDVPADPNAHLPLVISKDSGQPSSMEMGQVQKHKRLFVNSEAFIAQQLKNCDINVEDSDSDNQLSQKANITPATPSQNLEIKYKNSQEENTKPEEEVVRKRRRKFLRETQKTRDSTNSRASEVSIGSYTTYYTTQMQIILFYHNLSDFSKINTLQQPPPPPLPPPPCQLLQVQCDEAIVYGPPNNPEVQALLQTICKSCSTWIYSNPSNPRNDLIKRKAAVCGRHREATPIERELRLEPTQPSYGHLWLMPLQAIELHQQQPSAPFLMLAHKTRFSIVQPTTQIVLHSSRIKTERHTAVSNLLVLIKAAVCGRHREATPIEQGAELEPTQPSYGHLCRLSEMQLSQKSLLKTLHSSRANAPTGIELHQQQPSAPFLMLAHKTRFSIVQPTTQIVLHSSRIKTERHTAVSNFSSRSIGVASRCLPHKRRLLTVSEDIAMTQAKTLDVTSSLPWLPHYRPGIQRKNVPEQAIEMVLLSISQSTMAQYNTMKLWWEFCQMNKYSDFNSGVKEVMEFLQNMYMLDTKPFKYGTFNSYRSALALISPGNIGENLIFEKGFKGA